MKGWLRAACIACPALVAGCAGLGIFESREPAPWVQAGSLQPASDVESLVLYYEHIRKLAASDLDREHDSARRTYDRSRSDFDRVRYAMVLSLPNSTFNDDERALELLAPVANNQAGRLQGLAAMLSSHLQEQMRLNTSVTGLQRKLDALK